MHVVGDVTPPLTRLVALTLRLGRSVSVEWNGRDMSSLAGPATLNLMNADEMRPTSPAQRRTTLRSLHSGTPSRCRPK